MRDVWSALRRQVGPFTSFIDQRVTTPAAGLTAVVIGCQFEKAALRAGPKRLLKAAPESYWRDLEGYEPARLAATLRVPMLVLHGERDYQVTSADLQGWRDALEHRTDVTIKSYPTLNHLFMPGEGKATPAEYQRPGHVAEFVLDDIAAWIGNDSPDRRWLCKKNSVRGRRCYSASVQLRTTGIWIGRGGCQNPTAEPSPRGSAPPSRNPLSRLMRMAWA